MSFADASAEADDLPDVFKHTILFGGVLEGSLQMSQESVLGFRGASSHPGWHCTVEQLPSRVHAGAGSVRGGRCAFDSPNVALDFRDCLMWL